MTPPSSTPSAASGTGPRTAVVVGNLDGVHLGHRALVERARAEARGGRVIALSLDPHPLSVLRPDEAPGRLTTFAARTRLLEAAGADDVRRLDPDGGLLSETAEAFVEDLAATLRPGVIVEGADFRFGRGRAGDVRLLEALGRRLGFDVVVVDEVCVALEAGLLVRASSSLVRRLLLEGRVGDAARVLGRPHEIEGTVTSGDRRGRTIGFPTANVDHADLLLPADGVYAGVANDEAGREHPAAISIGTKPTFGRSVRTLEVHLVDHRGPVDRYDWTMRTRFLRWLRPQIRYADLDPLLDQMTRDVARTRRVAAASVDFAGALA